MDVTTMVKLAAELGKRDARKAVTEAEQKRAQSIGSPAGLASIFALRPKPPKRPREYRPPEGLKTSFTIEKGQRFTVAGLKRNTRLPGGWDTNCKPGEESILVSDADLKPESDMPAHLEAAC